MLLKKLLLMSICALCIGFVAPQKAEADAGLTLGIIGTALGGTALGLQAVDFFKNDQPVYYQSYPANSYQYYPQYTQPVYYPTYQPVQYYQPQYTGGYYYSYPTTYTYGYNTGYYCHYSCY